jgi:hypothetical protein
MKRLLLAFVFLPLVCAAGEDASQNPGKVFYYYDVKLPGDTGIKQVRIAKGEQADVELLASVTVYPALTTTVPKSMWKSLVRAKKLPAHDSATCYKTVCTYTVNRQTQDSRKITLSINSGMGVISTNIAYSEFKVTEIRQISGGNGPILPAPVSSQKGKIFFEHLDVGTTVDLPVGNDLSPGSVTLVRIGE